MKSGTLQGKEHQPTLEHRHIHSRHPIAIYRALVYQLSTVTTMLYNKPPEDLSGIQQ